MQSRIVGEFSLRTGKQRKESVAAMNTLAATLRAFDEIPNTTTT
jgi:hypothetical protein